MKELVCYALAKVAHPTTTCTTSVCTGTYCQWESASVKVESTFNLPASATSGDAAALKTLIDADLGDAAAAQATLNAATGLNLTVAQVTPPTLVSPPPLSSSSGCGSGCIGGIVGGTFVPVLVFVLWMGGAFAPRCPSPMKGKAKVLPTTTPSA